MTILLLKKKMKYVSTLYLFEREEEHLQPIQVRISLILKVCGTCILLILWHGGAYEGKAQLYIHVNIKKKTVS